MQMTTRSEKERRRAGLTVNDVYERLTDMVVMYAIRPGERINEVALAEQLGVSRTPLREALHRLVAVHMLDMVPNRGFYGRKLERQEVFDLYEFRNAIELAAVDMALCRASDEPIKQLLTQWEFIADNASSMSAHDLVLEDERFHVSLAGLSGNQELVRSLHAVNARIHYMRWSAMEGGPHDWHGEHIALLDALLQRDAATCRDILNRHISRRMEEIVQFIRASVIRLYTSDTTA